MPVSRMVLLDSGPLGLLSHPRQHREISEWVLELEVTGTRVCIPEIIDYEVRRELLRAEKLASVARLDLLKSEYPYLPLTTAMMLAAAKLWANTRRAGQPTAGDQRLDVDVILAAQAILLKQEGYEVVVATDNVRHLSRFVDAKGWRDIA